MAGILIRGLDKKTLNRLKLRAKRNGRSLQGEAKLILESASGYSLEEAKEVSERWLKRLAGRRFPSSVRLLRADRDR